MRSREFSEPCSDWRSWSGQCAVAMRDMTSETLMHLFKLPHHCVFSSAHERFPGAVLPYQETAVVLSSCHLCT